MAEKTNFDNYILIDIGAHLINKKFSRDVSSVISRAQDAGVSKILVPGPSLQGSKEALRLSRLYPGVLYATAGIHPHDAKSWDDETEKQLVELLQNPEVIAVGPTGLDFNRNFSPREIQLNVFEKQVILAKQMKKPLFLHERDAHEEMMSILKKHVVCNGLIHCFTGSKDEAENYISLGLSLGLTGILWKDKSQEGIRKLLKEKIIPLDRILLQSDSPFMYPNTRASKLATHIKGCLSGRSLDFLTRYCTFQRNEPCSLPATIEMIGALLEKSPDEVALSTTLNALKLFEFSC